MKFLAVASIVVALTLTPVEISAQDVEVETVIATGVMDREPQGVSVNFDANVGVLYGWTRVTGAANQTIEHVWTHGPHESVIEIEIGGSPWRVWSSKNIPPEWTGQWVFQVRVGGEVVSETMFSVN